MKKILKQFAIAGACILAHGLSIAETFPDRPVRIVVPYSAGGPIDGLMRALGQELSDIWKQPVLIENKPGANEAIGAQTVARAEPDGYTMLTSTESGLILNNLLHGSLTYNAEKDFVPVTKLVTVPMVLVTPADSPSNSIEEFISQAKASKGKPLAYGSSGVGGPTHLPLAKLAQDHGLSMTHVPYKGAAPLLQDMLGGRVDLATVAASIAEPYIKAGRLKGLVVSSQQRLASLPDVPTFGETSVPDLNASFVVGLAAPTGTPADRIAKVAEDARKVLLQDGFTERHLAPFAFTPEASTPDEFQAYLTRERPVQAELVRISGARMD